MHLNGRKMHHAAISACKSRINMEREVFMLQPTAGRSIAKMHQDPEKGFLQLQFIIIPLDSTEEQFCRWGGGGSTCRLLLSSGQTLSAVCPSMRKAFVPWSLLIS